MGYLYNNAKYIQRRRQLRKTQTDAERALWNRLKNKQCNGYKFYRQYSVGYYILDFYCPRLRLAIELDGGQHAEQEEYDKARTVYLLAHDIREIRFWNNEVIGNLNGVYEKILEYCPKH